VTRAPSEYPIEIVRLDLAPCYDSPMSAKLSSTNPHLRDPAARQRSVLKSVATSTAIEGIHAPFRKGSHSVAGKSTPKSLDPGKKR
jgi:hypothetical protein